MITGIVLAGSGDESFLDRIIRVLREGGVEEIIVVLEDAADAIRAMVPPTRPQVRLIENTHPDHGQFSSLLVGLRAAHRPGVRAVLVTLVDVPLVSADTVRTVLRTYKERKGALIVRPAREGQPGHPVLFDRALFQELRQADPAGGVRSVVLAHQADAVNVEVTDAGAFTEAPLT